MINSRLSISKNNAIFYSQQIVSIDQCKLNVIDKLHNYLNVVFLALGGMYKNYVIMDILKEFEFSLKLIRTIFSLLLRINDTSFQPRLWSF